MIDAKDLIEKFQYAYGSGWGYIWGQSGAVWTAAKQAAATREMTVKYGKKWIGHNVADCSGLFYWAFKQLGSSIYHGSNTIYKKYCSAKGRLINGRREDGQELKPGTAVFTGSENDHGHIGLYVGDGIVIEAKGTQAGVITSKITEKKWTYWGELKDVTYGASPTPAPTPTPTPEPEIKPTLRKGDRGEYVTLAQTKLIQHGYNCGDTGADGIFGNNTEKAVKRFQQDNYLAVDGVIGAKTWEALDSQLVFYTVMIPHLPKYHADALVANYSGATMTEERG